jgi:hypothetical protein
MQYRILYVWAAFWRGARLRLRICGATTVRRASARRQDKQKEKDREQKGEEDNGKGNKKAKAAAENRDELRRRC